MAAKKGKTTKKAGTKGKKAQNSHSFHDEVIILLTLAAALLLILSNFGIGGFLGNAVSAFLFGIFGLPAYIMPVLLFLGTAFAFSNKGNSFAYIKLGAGIGFSLMLCTFLQLLTVPFEQNQGILSFYTYAAQKKKGGGLIGGIFTKLLCPAFGIAGTYVIVVIFMIIFLVLITEKSFLRGLKKGSSKVYASAKEDARKRRTQAEERREARAQKEAIYESRQAQKAAKQEAKKAAKREKDQLVSGVTFDTTLAHPKTDLTELKTEEIPFEEQPLDFVINRAEPVLDQEMPEEILPVEDPFAPEVPAEKKSSRKKKKSSEEDTQKATEEVAREMKVAEQQPKVKYQAPPLSLLKRGKAGGGDSDAHLRETANKLQQTLYNFGVRVTVTNVSCGPSVTRYELQPEQGVKVSKIVGLADDIKLNLAAADIRIEAPIPGKAAVGIEVPNKETSPVMLRDLLETEEFQKNPSRIAFAAGRDIAGKVVVADIMKMPHLLIAGATGSGKSVCINTLIMSILYKADPDEVKLIMIDPKVVELSVYNGIPHLMIPVVTDPKKASGALNWAVVEMDKRYRLFAEYNVRDLRGYNEKVSEVEKQIENGEKPEKMPQIVIIVDELADLMMVAPGEIEEAICRLAQLARAAGIHLVLATQRPSVNVITGLIKANMPSRIAFSVSSGVDSRTIIDMNGAEKLLGKGDMLFYPSGYQKPARVQGAFVSDKEVQNVVEYLVTKNGNAVYNEEVENHVNSAQTGMASAAGAGGGADERDVYFVDAGRFIIEKDKASIGMLQRVFKIGFNRAARIMDQLFEAGVVGEEEGTKPRKVLMSMEEFEQYIEEYV